MHAYKIGIMFVKEINMFIFLKGKHSQLTCSRIAEMAEM